MKRSSRAGQRPAVLLVVVVMTVALLGEASAAAPYRTQIRGGSEESTELFPEVAALETPTGGCSGTLIAPRWVLTAGHCLSDVPAAPVTIGLDGTDFDTGFAEVYGSRSHIVHPSFDPRTLAYDFALIRLPSASSVPPAFLATGADAPLWEPGTPALIAGWGAVDNRGNGFGTLRLGSVDIESDDVCGGLYPNYDLRVMLCGGASQSDGCIGDSGGPLYVSDGEVLLQMGMTSFGDNCVLSQNGGAGAYSFIPAAREWINDRLAAGRVPRVQTHIRGRLSDANIRRGSRVRIAAWLTRASDQHPLRLQQVQLLRKRRGSDQRFTVVASKLTGRKGRVTFRQAPKRDMVYRLRHRRTAVTTAAKTPRVTVRVRQ